MQNPLLLFPQLNLAASEDKTHYRAMGSAAREEPQETNKPGAKQKRNRLSLLLQRPEVHGGDHLGRPGSLTKAVSVSPEEALKWGESFDKLLSEKAGLDAFTKFLKTEFSEENIEFWIACEDYKKIKSAQELLPKAKTIFETFIEKDAPKETLKFQAEEAQRGTTSWFLWEIELTETNWSFIPLLQDNPILLLIPVMHLSTSVSI
ncbi:regulator of G-protein signaling 18 isoform X3 [Parus major]|uniref:regulator of G-protein signaling 18 isoform X3 n=1 Tax=Parus major TaxID=9157 RepID=UPI001443F407|nr:regulator of G-protein signaling 18 isoform X3 [Parus major]